ncbi:MAG: hypothetical protein AAFQ37_02125 [Bacteroidota bacterium]
MANMNDGANPDNEPMDGAEDQPLTLAQKWIAAYQDKPLSKDL